MNEFSFLKDLREKHSLERVGDDCAILPLTEHADLLITVDMLVENVDFRLEWTTPEFLGHKSLAVSLSDIAAMGGEAKWSIISLALPEQVWATEFLDRFYEGWFALARKYGVELVGGDISRSPNGLVIDSTVCGQVDKGAAFLRSTARPGDLIYVSGHLGGAAGGLKLMESGVRTSPDLPSTVKALTARQLQPEPELSLAKSLQRLMIVTSAIDLSDGLSSDLGHICDQSFVGAKIDAKLIPVDPALSAHFPSSECIDLALNGGEDFRLLFTAAPEGSEFLAGLDVTRIGQVTADEGQIHLSRDGMSSPLRAKGFRHF